MNDDFDRIIASLLKHQAEFLIIGGYAVVFHGFVRNTQDLDLYIRPSELNAKKTVAALEEAGFSSPDLNADVFIKDNGISLGEEPFRVDLISRLPGVPFEEAWPRRENGAFGAQTAFFISRADLIVNKKAVGRPRDLDDARELEKGEL